MITTEDARKITKTALEELSDKEVKKLLASLRYLASMLLEKSYNNNLDGKQP